MEKQTIIDDAKERLSLLIKLRFPWLIAGLVVGLLASFIVSKYEKILSENISLAFFLPIIVYMSDAVGTQTEAMYVRSLSKSKDHFLKYLIKEIILGLSLGLIFGILIGFVSYFWIHSLNIALTVGIAMAVNIAFAPLIALIVPEILFKEHTDPALGAGPFTTVIQDIISILIYFFIASLIIG